MVRFRLRGNREAFINALGETFVNPFAQFSRLGAKPQATKTITSTNDIPKEWKSKPTMRSDNKRKREGGIAESSKKRMKINSFDNSPPSTNMLAVQDNNGSGNDAGLKETPVDTVGQVFRGPPNYTFASLPWYYDRRVSVTQYSDQWTFRMTSPYDCSVGASVVDQNVGAGDMDVVVNAADAADGSAQKARWFDFYAGMYKYYHVVSCRWHLTIENQSTEPLWVHQYYSNDTDRPVTASNQDMLMWPDTESHYVGEVGNNITSTGTVERNELNTNSGNAEDAASAGNNPNFETGNIITSRGRSPILQLSGQYAPGDYNREIRLDSEVENWTRTNTNPILAERLAFRVRPQWDAQNLIAGSANSYERLITYRWVYRCEYLVEFKELVDGLRYPVQQQPLTVTISELQGIA